MNAEYLRDVVSRQVGDVAELVELLEIDIEDILIRFTDKLFDHAHKFGVNDRPTGE